MQAFCVCAARRVEQPHLTTQWQTWAVFPSCPEAKSSLSSRSLHHLSQNNRFCAESSAFLLERRVCPGEGVCGAYEARLPYIFIITVEKSLLLRRASEDIKLDWMLPEDLLSVIVAPPRVYLLVPRGLVLCLLLFMLALG